MLQLVLLILVAAHKAMQDVVAVGGNHQLADGQAHFFGQVAGKDIAEVTGGHRERHAAVRATQGQGCLEVVHDLGHDPRPVDGVHRRQLGFAAQEGLVAEALLHHALAVVEVTFDSDVVDVITLHRGHLAALNFRHPLVRMQDKDIHVLAATAAFNSGRAGITGGSPHDHHVLVTLFQNIVEQATQKLQGEVLERQRGATEQFHHPLVGIQLYQRRDGLVREHAVGFVQHLAEVIGRNGIFHERIHDLVGQFGIRQATPASDFFQAEVRKGFRHIQAAIGGQSGQKNVFKAQSGSFTPCTDVSHVRTCQLKFSARMRTTLPSTSARASISSMARFIWRS